jgi:uncharacterized protein YbaA (DUF1428 family)
MSKSNRTEIEQGIGSEVFHFVYRIPKKNHEAMMQLNKQFADTMRTYGALHLIFQLNNTEAPMEGITNIAKTILANQQDEEVWMELIFYRDRSTKMRSVQRCKMMRIWNDSTNSLWICLALDPASSWVSSAASRFK